MKSSGSCYCVDSNHDVSMDTTWNQQTNENMIVVLINRTSDGNSTVLSQTMGHLLIKKHWNDWKYSMNLNITPFKMKYFYQGQNSNNLLEYPLCLLSGVGPPAFLFRQKEKLWCYHNYQFNWLDFELWKIITLFCSCHGPLYLSKC